MELQKKRSTKRLNHTKNIFKKITIKVISFLGVLNWVTVHSQTESCVEIISTPRDWKVKHARVFQIALEG